MTKKKNLLFSVTKKDLNIDFFCASGPGGQKRNRTKSACRITHRDSGAIGMCKKHKSSEQNKKQAFVRMATSVTFKQWQNKRVREILANKTLKEEVDELMSPENIRIEIFDKENKRWKDQT